MEQPNADGTDCPAGKPGCDFTDTQLDLSEYSMHILRNIIHSGNAQQPHPVPEHLNVAEADWIEFSCTGGHTVKYEC